MSTGNQQLLQRYAKPLFVPSAIDDTNVPFSFKDWIVSHQGIIPGQEFTQYNDYLLNWYKQKSEVITDTKIQLKLNYLTLLKQLQMFFTREEAENWYNKVNLDNEKELLLAIPYFAKKLKDISLYYLQLRTAIKESRLRYNQTGTNSGIINQLQKFILTNYTKKPNSFISIPGSIWKDIPELSAVRDNIAIQIEELYDAQNYFDRSPTLPPSAYYVVDSAELEDFLTTKGLTLTSTEWIYRLGVSSLSGDFAEFANTDLTELGDKIAEKYLGEDKFISFSATSSAERLFYDIDINQDNNFFYWPEGVYRSKAKQQQRLQPIPINESGLVTVATPGSSIELADTIFVKTTRDIKGAWFRNQLFDYKTLNMNAVLNFNDKTVFRFPFPGYGLSAEDISWTGFGLDFDPTYFFLDPEIQEKIENEYWSTQIPASAIKPLSLNDTTLVDSKAFANLDFNKADKIDVWFNPPEYNESVYSDEKKSAWLYRFNKTDISIGLEDNTIVWPFEKIDPNTDYPSYYPKNISDTCLSIPISSLKIAYSNANNSLSGADVIYKLTNYKDTKEDAVEASWLYQPEAIISGDKAVIHTPQNSFQLLIDSGEQVNFIWTGRDLTDVDTVFKTLEHQPDCPFANLFDKNFLNFEKCECKQVHFTPFGHPGEEYTDNQTFTDFIVEDNFTPEKFELTEWKDSLGNDYTTSSSFAWYKTNSIQGWGDGRWHSGGTGNKMFLRNGKRYIYYRAKSPTKDTSNIILPSYVVRYTDTIFTAGSWKRAVKNENNDWVQTDQPTSMALNPGDILLYDRKTTNNFILSSTVLEEVNYYENRGSIWSNVDYVSISDTTTVAVTIPLNTLPGLNFTTPLTVIQWNLTKPNSLTESFTQTPGFTFNPSQIGIYSITVSLLTGTSVTPVTITNIPSITAVSNIENVTSLTSVEVPIPGFVWNTSLQGWDYNLGIKSKFARPTNQGGRPFWAKAYIEKDINTKYRGIQSWGTPHRFVDNFNVISQPEISDIVLNVGNSLSYTRNLPVDIKWSQPVDFEIFVDRKEWCTLEFEVTSDSNISYQLNNFKNILTVNPTTSVSNLNFETLIDNEPTEVYYNAINPFTWSISATPEIERTVFSDVSATLAIKTNQPWANLSNQFYPTFAAFPSIDLLYSSTDKGGFFTPSNLGISVYVDKDYVTVLDVSSSALTGYFEDVQERVGGRGFSKQDQPSPYIKIKENNIWLKEPTVAGPIAGTIKKSIFKKYQKFIPYQSGYESNPRSQLGMLTPTSRQTPWTGEQKSEWGDKANFPQSPTGELNVQAWADTQILKQSGLQVDNWCTDVFGNQYALYKQLSSATPYNRKFITGEIWARKNSQFTSPGSISLKDVFDTYINTNLINELTGQGIRKIDLFFDTLLIETSGTVIFEKLNYDFDTDNIFSLTDEARFISLAMPVETNLSKELTNTDLSQKDFAVAGETWFFPEEKQVTQSTCGLKNYILTPELFRLDINNLNFKKIFPLSLDDTITINQLSSLELTHLDPPTISHNSLNKEYLLTILGKNKDNETTIIEFIIKDLPIPFLQNIVVYQPIPKDTQLNPPFIDQDLYTKVEITNLEFLNALDFQCTAQNGPVVFEPIDLPSWVSLSPNGRFTGTPPQTTELYNVTFKVTNSIGPTFYNLVIDVNFVLILTFYYLYTEGYDSIDGDGLLVQEDHDPDNEIFSRIIHTAVPATLT